MGHKQLKKNHCSKLSGKSLMYIEKSSGPSIDPWEMPVCTGAHWILTVKNYSLLSAITKKTQTIWVVFLKYQEFQVYVKDLMSHVIKSFWSIQKIASSSDGLWSESEYVLWTIDKSWFTQDALGQKPDCFDVSKEHEYRIKNIFKYFSTNW